MRAPPSGAYPYISLSYLRELPRTHLLGTSVNKGKRDGQGVNEWSRRNSLLLTLVRTSLLSPARSVPLLHHCLAQCGSVAQVVL